MGAVDYAALAEQARKSAPVDYAALAEQARSGKQPLTAPEQAAFDSGYKEQSTAPSFADNVKSFNYGNAAKNFGSDLWNSAKSVGHMVVDPPQGTAEKALSYIPMALQGKRALQGYAGAVRNSADMARTSAEKGDNTGVAINSAAAGLPLFGPAISGLYEQSKSGDTSGAVGTGLSRALQVSTASPETSPLAPVGNLFSKAMPKASYGLMNNVIGTFGRDLEYSNPGRAAVKEGIMGSSRPIIMDKINAAIPARAQELNNAAAARSGTTVNLENSVNTPFDNALAESDIASTPYRKALRNTQKELNYARDPNTDKFVQAQGPVNQGGSPPLQGINVSSPSIPEALQYRRMLGKRANFQENSVGQNVKPVINEAYGGVTRDIHAAAPEMVPLDDQLAGLQSGRDVLRASIGRRLSNPSPIGWKDAAPSIVGNAAAGPAGAVGLAALNQVLDSSLFKSSAAQGLYKSAPLVDAAGKMRYGMLSGAVRNRR